MEYDEEELRCVVEQGLRAPGEGGGFLIKPTFIAMKEEVSCLRPYEYIYGKFEYGE